MLKIGCHLSSAKGYEAMGKTACLIQANTFQFFTRNPRGTRAKAINEEDMKKLLILLKKEEIGPLVAHAPYSLNLASSDKHLRELAQEIMADDLRRLEYLPGNYYNFHPGCHVGQGRDKGIAWIAEGLNKIVRPEQTTTVLLETMAGKGTEIGGRFEDLREILDRVECVSRVGVCLDTCHVWDGGYDIAGNLEGVLAEFDRVIGLSRLKAVHLNDSKNPLGARKDRHAKIGEGYIGEAALAKLVAHPVLRHLPFCLETPNMLDGYAQEIAKMREAWYTLDREIRRS